MVMLTIEGLKKALNHIQDNSTTIRYYERSSKRGLIVTDGMGEDESYHIRVVELLQPKLITQLAESFTALSLAGQELLDILSDDAYLASLTNYLNRQGYTNPSDRQVFRLLQDRMQNNSKSPWEQFMYDALSRMASYAPDTSRSGLAPIPAVNLSDVQGVNTQNVEFADTVQIEPPTESPTAEQLIQNAKKKVAK